jgi:hypothetical protein
VQTPSLNSSNFRLVHGNPVSKIASYEEFEESWNLINIFCCQSISRKISIPEFGVDERIPLKFLLDGSDVFLSKEHEGWHVISLSHALAEYYKLDNKDSMQIDKILSLTESPELLEDLFESLWKIPELPRDWEEGLAGEKRPASQSPPFLPPYIPVVLDDCVVDNNPADTTSQETLYGSSSEGTTEIISPVSTPVSAAQSSPQATPLRRQPPVRPPASPINAPKGAGWNLPPSITAFDPTRIEPTSRRSSDDTAPKSPLPDEADGEVGGESGFRGEYFVPPALDVTDLGVSIVGVQITQFWRAELDVLQPRIRGI